MKTIRCPRGIAPARGQHCRVPRFILLTILLALAHNDCRRAVLAQTAMLPAKATATKTPQAPKTVAKPVASSTAPGVNATTNSSAATNSVATGIYVDPGQSQLGGKLYSTGTSDIILRVVQNVSVQQAPKANNRHALYGQAYRVNEAGFADGIFLLSPGPERFIASNRQLGRAVNLGTLPAGEIILDIKTPVNYTFQTGGAERNPDNLVHAIVKTFTTGAIEVWFEDLPGPGSDFDYNDVVVQLSGGITTQPVSNVAVAKNPAVTPQTATSADR